MKTYDYIKMLMVNLVIAEITDNGCGSKIQLDNLFKPNFSTKSTGMGLGLAITKKSLDDMKEKLNLKIIF
ncbi:MAG: ATP-binding protein [Ignavibacteria bacterium]